jgi:homoserine dehydrogenase
MMGIETYYTNNQTVMAGNTIDYGSLTLNILMDEDFRNYVSIFNWLESFRGKEEWYNLTKDTKLHILSANKKVLTTWTFIQSFPTNIQEIQFDSSVMDVVPIIFSTEIRYQFFKIETFTK